MNIKKVLKRTSIIAAFLVLFGVLWSCAAYKYVTPYDKFNHDKHVAVLLHYKKDCYACHKTNDNETDPLKRLKALKENVKKPDYKGFVGKKMCHVCHQNPETKLSEAPSKCSVCHENLRLILPDSHHGKWKETHRIEAKVSDKSCMNCHDRWFCTNCHVATDKEEAYRHPRTFRVSHMAAALSDPASCSRCHNSSFCSDCHRR